MIGYRVCHGNQLRSVLQEQLYDIRMVIFSRQMERGLTML